jgi:OPA family glycerol-3-phosphate transporter-like MFS transporter
MGTACMALLYGYILPDDSIPGEAANPDNWISWPISMVPISALGLILAVRLWNAKPQPKKAATAS